MEYSNLSSEPFFIVYDARSGSTLLANLLMKSANVAIPPESNWMTRVLAQYPDEYITTAQALNTVMEIVEGDRKFSDWQLSSQAIREQVTLPLSVRDFVVTLCQMYQHRHCPNTHLFGIKKGGYIKAYKNIKRVFPRSKFIGVVRDGRAVFNSKKNSIYSATGKPFETNPYRAAREWCSVMKLMHELYRDHAQDTLIIRYEDLVTDPDQTLNTVFDFLQIAPAQARETRMYQIPDRYGDLHQNIEKKPMPARATAWKNSLSEAEIAAFESVAYQDLLAGGYELWDQKPVAYYRTVGKLKQVLGALRA